MNTLARSTFAVPHGTGCGTAHAAARVERREQAQLLGTSLPAAAVIALVLGVPCLWLLGLSFLAKDGSLTLQNYKDIFTDDGYARTLWLTLWLAGVTTAICAVAGYLLAYAMTLMPRPAVALVLALVALPFWTSVLVRTYAWLILLQNRGIVNNLVTKAGIIDEPLRMMHNSTGALIGMVHIMLPFMVFPLYAALSKIDPDHVKAAAGLGASPFTSFWRVFFPQSMPGIVAGSVLVFVMSLGFYITPALLGGGRVIVMSIAIEHDISRNMNWGPGGAVGMLFTAGVLAIFVLVSRFVSIERLFQR